MAADDKSVTVHVRHDPQVITGTKLFGIMVGIMTATFLIGVDVSIVGTAIPAITTRFNTVSDIGWYAAVEPLTMCALQPLMGKITTLFSLRWTYLTSCSIFLLGSLLCGVATSSVMFIIGRAVVGMGGVGILSGGLSIIALVTPASQHPLFTGLLIALYSVGSVVGPLIGGAFTRDVTWRWCFLINLPIGSATIGLLLLFFHPPKTWTSDSDTQPSQKSSFWTKLLQLDLIGCFLFVPSIVMLFLALQWGGDNKEHPWDSPTIIGLLVGFPLLLLVFAFWEVRQGEHAMIPLKLLKRRSVILSTLFSFFFAGAFVLSIYYLPQWFQAVENVSAMRSGVMLLPSVCMQVFGAATAGVLARYLRYYNPWFFLGSAMLCIASGLYTTFSPPTTSPDSTSISTTPASEWIGFQVLQGLGCGFAAQTALLTVQNVLRETPQLIPVGISTVLFAQFLGSAVIQTIAGSLLNTRLVDGLEELLVPEQVAVLLQAGTFGVRRVVLGLGLEVEMVDEVVAVYSGAITDVFYISVASSAVAFVVALGIRWDRIGGKPSADLV
ncbi:major facilitator superfamily-domain-containing protein [Aspergillus karnatakaensis]|uniref:MDR family MFS transporter n=1 Tax=Aspergillus karnatakaensis TaxID=1810916 RepID=UPI003CCDB577